MVVGIGLAAISAVGLERSVGIEAFPFVGSMNRSPKNTPVPSKNLKKQASSSVAKPKNINTPQVKSDATTATAAKSTDCNNGAAMHPGLAGSSSSQLRALAVFESVCGAGVSKTASFFAPTPTNAQQAKSYANDIVAQLRAFSANGISPVIFLEPTAEGNILDFNQYAAGAFTPALDSYFAAIRAAGITDAQMGLWVSFPEGNIPVWNNVDAATFNTNVSITMSAMKRIFPGAKGGLLLDSMTYPSGTSWSGGRYVSLLPYVRNIPGGLIDSVGLQGFPWSPPATEGGPALTDPKVYLQINEAEEAARTLGVNEVWMNTGSFSTTYSGSPTRRVSKSPADRQKQLDGAVQQAIVLRQKGFSTAIHLFAENKAATAEGIDWSYWQNAEHTAVFKSFTHDAQAAGVPIWIFDAK